MSISLLCYNGTMALGDHGTTPGSGTYALVLHLDRDAKISVGKLGDFRFAAGYYCYVGSARGPGGIDARVARHLRRAKRPHWHVDYLLRHTRVLGIWAARSTARLECIWAGALLQLPGALVCARGFGSSDCSCETHLVYCSSPRSFRALCTCLNSVGAVNWLVNSTDGEPAHEQPANMAYLCDSALPACVTNLPRSIPARTKPDPRTGW